MELKNKKERERDKSPLTAQNYMLKEQKPKFSLSPP